MPHISGSHIELMWRLPEMRAWYERLAENHLLVGYDARGTGLSDRTAGFTLYSPSLDLDAVVERLGLDRLDL